jgi:hypothetical protein
MLCGLVLTLLWRVPPDGRFFHGLEYEDSYVYTVAARQVLEHTAGNEAPIGFPYSISTCGAGSIHNCHEWQSFPEHLIGTAYVISAYSRLVGYTPDAGAWVALWAACISCCLIFVIIDMISNDPVAATSGAVIFAITPIFAAQGLESSAEPVSNAAISVVLFLLLYLLRYFPGLSVRRSILALLALTISIAFAMTVKRENALLLIVAPLLLLTIGRPNLSTGLRMKIYVVGVVAVWLICGLFAWHLNIAHTGEGELSLVSQFRPTFSILFNIIFSFVRSFMTPAWYLCGFIFVAWGIFASRHGKLRWAVTLPFLVYLALYAFHIRGYYELRSGESDPREALRFEMNLMSFWSILGGLGVAAAFRRIRLSNPNRRTRLVNAASGCLVLGLFTLSYTITRSLRMDGVEDEATVRIAPAVRAVKLASDQHASPDYIITFEPLVAQMYGDPNVNVLDISIVERADCERLGLLAGTAQAVLIDEDIHHSAADADRYSEQLSFLSNFTKKPVNGGDGFTIARINFVPKRDRAPLPETR